MAPDLTEALEAARAGDDAGFAELFRAFHPPLLRYLRVTAGEAADDVASDAWLEACRDLHRFRGGPDDFRRWLFSIARLRFLDRRRAERRRPAVPVAPGDRPEPADRAPDPAVTVSDRLSAAEALALLRDLLPPDQAEVVVLRAVVGLDVAEVAALVGRRPGTVRVLAHRGLRTLARRLDPSALRSGSEV